MCERISILQPSRFHPCPSRRDSFKTDCKDPMFGNSVWQSCWQKYGFISVNKFETFAYVVGLSVPRKFELNFWYMSWSLRVSFHPARVRTEIYKAQGRTLTVVFISGSTKPAAHPENGSGVSPRNTTWRGCLPEKISLTSENLKLVSQRKAKPFRCSTRHCTEEGRVLEVSPWRMRSRSAEVTQILGSRVIAARLEVTTPGREVY